MKYIAIVLLAWLAASQAGGDSYVCKNAKVSIFSKAPLEDISALSGKAVSVYNPATGELVFSVPVRSFVFEKSLMQEHFNENYMESDKYPNASFKGKILDKVDVSKDGTYTVKAAGVLDVHGIKQNRTIEGKVQVNKGAVKLSSEFIVKCKDHQIDVPRLVFQKIAENIQVKVAADYSRYQK